MLTAASYCRPSTSGFPQKRKLDRVIELTLNRSIGNITSAEFKRRTTLKEINRLGYDPDKTTNLNSMDENFLNLPNYKITSMECDPKEGRFLLVSSATADAAIYDVSNDVDTFKQIVRLRDARSPFFNRNLGNSTHSVHWLWNSSIFTIGTTESIHFWDSSTCELLESVKFSKPVLNHVIASSKCSGNQYVAVAGCDGRVSLIDMRFGIITMTMPTVENSPIRAICWHPTNELQYVTGNDLGNIFLWDIRFKRKCIRKLNNNDSFALASSHSYPILGLNFYHNGSSIMSIDYDGWIKTWNIYSGVKYPTYYEPVLLSQIDDSLRGEVYQFATTDNMSQDVAFLPSSKGLRMFDINTGEHLHNSNDKSLSLNCLAYDPINMHVYCSCQNTIKVWTPRRDTPT